VIAIVTNMKLIFEIYSER